MERVTPGSQPEVQVGLVQVDVAGPGGFAPLRVRLAGRSEAPQGLHEAPAARLQHGEAVVAVGDLRAAPDALPRGASAQESLLGARESVSGRLDVRQPELREGQSLLVGELDEPLAG